ncbi:AI-2E family transporter [Undibacterium arcticum]|uniref:AI-2E family transporter n=1 Tax=Undibacterium arcticum TaxID=1762892 RepID=UPI0036132160
MKLPRAIATTVVMLTLLGGTVAVTNTLYGEFQAILEQLPDAAHKLARAIPRSRSGERGTIEQIQAAATEIETATSRATDGDLKRRPATPAAESPFKLSSWLWAGSMGAVEWIGQSLMVLFLVFFLLLSGDMFKRKLVKLTGPTISQKRITVHMLDGINRSIQHYMFTMMVTNALAALLMWGAFRWIGLENAGAWALAGGFLHIIPYFGPLLTAIATGLAAFMQFSTFPMLFLVAGSSLAIATVVGIFVTTWMAGRITKTNAAAVFIGLLFWGWLWGISGLLLGIPIIVIVKVVSEHIAGLQLVAELLGE